MSGEKYLTTWNHLLNFSLVFLRTKSIFGNLAVPFAHHPPLINSWILKWGSHAPRHIPEKQAGTGSLGRNPTQTSILSIQTSSTR